MEQAIPRLAGIRKLALPYWSCWTIYNAHDPMEEDVQKLYVLLERIPKESIHEKNLYIHEFKRALQLFRAPPPLLTRTLG